MTRRGIVVWRRHECGAASGGAEEICPAAMLDRLGLSEINCLTADRICYFHSVTSSLRNHAFASDARSPGNERSQEHQHPQRRSSHLPVVNRRRYPEKTRKL